MELCFYVLIVYLFIILDREEFYFDRSMNSCDLDRNYWKNVAHEDITNILQRTRNENVAKNIILFVADGMGLTTSTAARIYGETEKGYLAFEKFPDIGVLKVYSF